MGVWWYVAFNGLFVCLSVLVISVFFQWWLVPEDSECMASSMADNFPYLAEILELEVLKS